MAKTLTLPDDQMLILARIMEAAFDMATACDPVWSELNAEQILILRSIRDTVSLVARRS